MLQEFCKSAYDFLKVAGTDVKLISSLSNNEPLGNQELICTLLLLFPLLFCLMMKVLMIQSGITHETKPQISQKTNECQLLSSAATTHPALPEHLLLHDGLKPLPSSAAKRIYISFLTLFCNLLCVGASGFQGLELQKGDKPFPCFLLIVFSTQISERGEIWLLLKQVLSSHRERGCAQLMSMQLLLEPCHGWVEKARAARAL